MESSTDTASLKVLGLAFNPDGAQGAAGIPPGNPPAFNLNSVTQGINTSQFSVTLPAMQLKLLESDSKTKILARPTVRGLETWGSGSA